MTPLGIIGETRVSDGTGESFIETLVFTRLQHPQFKVGNQALVCAPQVWQVSTAGACDVSQRLFSPFSAIIVSPLESKLERCIRSSG